MFDINEIISAAFTQATTLAVKPLLERIEALETNIAMMRNSIDLMQNSIDLKDTRLAALETKLTEAKLFERTTDVTIPVDKDAIIDHLNQQEWFWEKLRKFADVVVEQAMDNHCETYDHDNYDDVARKMDDMPDPADVSTHEGVRDEIEDVLNGATLSIRL